MMIQQEINCIALGYIAHCANEQMACSFMHPETICDHLEDSLQCMAGLIEWLPKSAHSWLILSDADMRDIMRACHKILGWKDAIIY